MKDYKNIDRLFQEKFRDFEQIPSSHLWKNISDTLSGNPKKDRRVLWLWLSGIAAGLALLVTFNNPFSTTIITPKTNSSNTNDVIIKNNNPETEITNTTNDLNTTQTKIIKRSPDQEEITTNTTQENYNLTPSQTQNTSNNKHKNVDETHIVSNKSSNQQSNTAITDLKKNIPKDKTTIAQANNSIKESTDKSIINLTENAKQPDKKITFNSTEPKEKTNTISLESINKNNTQPDEIIANSNQKKWSVSTVAAPVIFGAFDKDVSSIDSQFDNNTKRGQLSAAYGVQLAYQVNDRFKVQSGLHKVDYGYKTYNVYVLPDSYASVYSNITYDDNINLIDINPIPHSQQGSGNQETGNINDSEGVITQLLGYYEIPIEAKYNLKKGNFGVNVLGGFSTLILSNNEIYVQTTEFSNKIGEASNLNSLNLTGNLGLELDYKLYQNIHVNFTPIFKIHANTFKKDTGGFNPYAIGIYSGLNYRF